MAGYWSGVNYYGDATNETVHGTIADEFLFGREGDDSLFGEGGNDVIDGGVGSDTLDGGTGNDTLIDVASIPSGFSGIIGRDTLRGGEGDDILEFRSPDTGDKAFGDAGTDTIKLDFRDATETQRVAFRVAPNSVVKLNDANTVAVLSVERVNFLGGKGDDFVIGGDLNDTLTGGLGGYGFGHDGNDTLRGMGGDDIIDGGTGIQQIDGGEDNDTASFDLASSGVAVRIVSGALINLGSLGSVRNVENLDRVKTSSGNDIFSIDQTRRISIDSGSGDDRITVGDGGGGVYSGQGNDVVRMGAGSDYVNPGYGADVVYLGAGNDSSDNYEGGSSRSSTEADQVYGEDGGDSIYTSAGADRVDGGIGNDTLYAGGGADTVLGGDGNDRIEAEGGADTVDGGAGDDTINSDYDYWTATTPVDNDVIRGGSGNDTITAGIGLDLLIGGLGDDKLIIGPALGNNTFDLQVDQLQGNGGVDTLGFGGLFAGSTATLSVTIAATTTLQLDGQDVAEATGMERLDITAYGDGDHQITGGRFADKVTTGNGDDTISTLGGDDTITAYDYGGTDSNTILTGTGHDTVNIYLGGNDEVDLDSGNDALTLSNVYTDPTGLASYEGGVGTDMLTVYTRFGFAGVSFDGATLRSGATVIGNATGFEGVTYYGSSDAFDFNGLSGSDHIELGAANDTAFGNDGGDTLLGGAGIDTLGGGAGDDYITGGAGRDFMTGDAGIDRFIYVSKADSTLGAERDSIADFATGIDKIDLGAISFGALSWRGTGGFTNTGVGELRYAKGASATVVQGDIDGNGVAEFQIVLNGSISLAASDFVL